MSNASGFLFPMAPFFAISMAIERFWEGFFDIIEAWNLRPKHNNQNPDFDVNAPAYVAAKRAVTIYGSLAAGLIISSQWHLGLFTIAGLPAPEGWDTWLTGFLIGSGPGPLHSFVGTLQELKNGVAGGANFAQASAMQSAMSMASGTVTNTSSIPPSGPKPEGGTTTPSQPPTVSNDQILSKYHLARRLLGRRCPDPSNLASKAFMETSRPPIEFVFFDIGGTLAELDSTGKLIPLPGIVEMLTVIQSGIGLRIGVITTLGDFTNSQAQNLLKQAGLLDFLDPQGFISEHDVLDQNGEEVKKPAPAIYEFAAQKVGVPVERCLFVGENPIEVNGALAVGMRAILKP